MDAMPRPRPPHLHLETSRHGKPCWYVRVGKGPRIRLRAEYGTDAFFAEYRAALTGSPKPAKGSPATGTLAWLIARYRDSGTWTNLSAGTRAQCEPILRKAAESAGVAKASTITSATIREGLERRSATPGQARNFLFAMRSLFVWAKAAGFVPVDPTAGIKGPPRKKGEGFRPWTENDVAAYEARWPIGTRQRVWLDVLLYTGLRRGDAVRFGRQHVRNGVGRITTEKSGYMVPVSLPILPVLQRTLDAGPCGDLTFICGARGQPLTKDSFGNDFRDACAAAGLPGKRAHGVRKIAATRAAHAGATVAELDALFGWKGGHMASLYTQSADRERLALGAIGKLAGNAKRTKSPAPIDKVRAPGLKDK
jgi:integrase